MKKPNRQNPAQDDMGMEKDPHVKYSTSKTESWN